MRALSAIACFAAACSSTSVDPQAWAAAPVPEHSVEPAAAERAAARASVALAAARMGRYEEAEEEAQAALTLDPRAGRAHTALGLCAMHRAQAATPPDLAAWHRAEAHFLRAVRLTDDADARVALARFYVAEGHGRVALEALMPVLARQPQHEDALRLAGLVAFEAGEERKARGYLARLHAVAPADAPALYRLAMCEATVAERLADRAAQEQAWRHVGELFRRYRVLAPDDVQGLLGEAWHHLQLWQLGGKKDQAALAACRELYRAARGLDPANVDAIYGEGFVQEALGDTDGAIAAYRRALELVPTHTASLLNLAALHAERGELTAARALWTTVLRAGVTSAERRKLESLLADGPP